MTPLIIAGAVAIAAAVALWLLRRNRDPYGSGGGFGGGSDEDFYRELARREQLAAEMKAARKAAEQPQDIRETLEKGDEAVAKLMMELAGLQPGNHRMAAKDDEVIRRIARALDPDTCKVLSFASKSNVQLDQIDLKSRTEMRPSSHPADTFEVESMKSDDQFGSVIPEELALPDEVFW